MTLATVAGLAAALIAALIVLGALYGAAYTAWAENRWPPAGRMIDTAEGALHVIEAGQGPSVVLVHGASANNRELRSTLEAPLVAAGFRVIAYDRPGFGASPPFAAEDRLDGQARVLAALIEAEALDRPIVVGHSYGGAIALRLALDHPGLAGGYVLLGPATHGDVGPVAWYNHAGAAPVVGDVLARAVVPAIGPLMARGGLEETFAPQPAPEDHAAETGVGLIFRPETFLSNAADLASVNAELLAQQERYGAIEDPVAIVAGDGDLTVSTERHAERTAAAIPDARLAILPNVGHMPHHAAPGLIVEHIEALGRLRAQRSEGEAAGAAP